MAISKKFIEILKCTKCKRRLIKKGMFLVCNRCNTAFPILDKDVPDMLAKDSWGLEKAKKNKFKHRVKL